MSDKQMKTLGWVATFGFTMVSLKKNVTFPLLLQMRQVSSLD